MKKILLVLAVIAIAFYAYSYKNHMKRSEVSTAKVIAPPPPQIVSLTFLKIVGQVTVEQNGKIENATEGMLITNNSTVKTGEKSLAILGYGKDFTSKIKVASNTKFDFSKFALHLPNIKEGISLRLLLGSLLLKIHNPSKQKILKVVTRTAAMGIRGTTFLVKENEKDSVLIVKNGAVEIEDENTSDPQIVESNSGFKISASGARQIDFKKYKINWDVEDQETEILTFDLLNFLSKVEYRLNELKEQIIQINLQIDQRKSESTGLEKENSDIQQDILCLKKHLSLKNEECRLVSKMAKNKDPLFLDNKYIKEMEKRMLEIKEDLPEVAAEKAGFQQRLVELETIYLPAMEKLKTIRVQKDNANNEGNMSACQEILQLLKDDNLTNDFEKM